jgi:hypothetical protein
MLKTAFYIIERPFPETTESKEAETDGVDSIVHDHTSLAPLENWTFCEEITTEYAIAQSTIHRIYGNKIQETGHRTLGHLCVTDEDRKHANSTRGSLLYGELLPRGVNRALDSKHLNALKQGQQSLLDLGMGTGKVVLQVFLQCPNLNFVYGVELSSARFRVAQAAALQLVDTEKMDDGTGLMINRFEVVEHIKDRVLQIRDRLPAYNYHHNQNSHMGASTTDENQSDGNGGGALLSSLAGTSTDRILYLEWNNLLETSSFIGEADMVLLETDIPSDTMLRLACLLYQMKPGSRILSYLDLSKVWEGHGGAPFTQLELNKSLVDRFPTSWSVHRGHHFYLWTKTGRSLNDMFSYYTNQRRIPPDAPPPYPPHSASMIRSMMTTANILGSGVSSTSSSSSSTMTLSNNHNAVMSVSRQSRGSASYSRHRQSSQSYSSSNRQSNSSGGSPSIQPHNAESLNVRLERALSAPGTSLDSSNTPSFNSYNNRKVRGDGNDGNKNNKKTLPPSEVTVHPPQVKESNVKQSGRNSFLAVDHHHRHSQSSKTRSKSFSSKASSSNCSIM